MKDLDRVDGKAKVTGAAKYAAEYNYPNLAYGIIAGSTIANGSIIAMDTKNAEQAPGVLTVITHLNLPKPPGYKSVTENEKPLSPKKEYKVFADNIIRFNGQPIALVIADTFERAVYAASLVKAQYVKKESHTDFNEERKTGKPIEGGDDFKNYVRGDADAYKVKLTSPAGILSTEYYDVASGYLHFIAKYKIHVEYQEFETSSGGRHDVV